MERPQPLWLGMLIEEIPDDVVLIPCSARRCRVGEISTELSVVRSRSGIGYINIVVRLVLPSEHAIGVNDYSFIATRCMLVRLGTPAAAAPLSGHKIAFLARRALASDIGTERFIVRRPLGAMKHLGVEIE